MTKKELLDIAAKLMPQFSPATLSADMQALLGAEEFTFFDMPLIGFASADDPLFEKFKEENAVGHQFIAPQQWLSGAKSVISIFVPYSAAVKKANSRCGKEDVASEYIYAKNYTVPFIDALVEKIIEIIKAEGYSFVIPSAESARMKEAVTNPDGSKIKYTSGWSERHIAYACGLGSFGISGALITEKGGAGRFISIVTDMPLEADERKYSEIYEYCTFCGACNARCPVSAISMEKGKDKAKCSSFVNITKDRYAPSYGCAKCQCGVPCANGMPKTRK